MEFEVGPTGVSWAAMRFARLPEGEAYVPRELRCPACWSHDSVPGLPWAGMDRFWESLHRFPYECRACGKRFYWYRL